MKKSSLILLSMMLAGTASAKSVPAYGRDLTEEETHPVTYVEIALADPLQVPQANYNVSGFRWDIIYGNNFKMAGLDLGLVARVNDTFSGLALTACDWVDGDVTGAQLTGLANVGQGNATGFQGAALLNYNHGTFTGFQSALVNFDGTVEGVQFGGVNWTKGVSYGLQVGFGNIAVTEFHGWALGAINYTDRMSGLQLGVINMASESGYGVQIGVFNGAQQFTGVQIGALNVIGNATIPVLPIVNGNF